MKNVKMVVGSVFVVTFLVLAYVVFKGGWLAPRGGAAMGGDTTATAPPAATGAGPAASGEAVTAPVRTEPAEMNALPAWMNGGAEGAVQGAAPPVGPASQAQAERSLRMQAAVQKLQTLQAKGAAIDPLEAERALSDLEKANGSSVLQGIRLDVLRENLRVAAQMQKAAEELQVLQRGDNSAAKQAEIGRKVAEVQALQKQLRMDFQTTPEPAARP